MAYYQKDICVWDLGGLFLGGLIFGRFITRILCMVSILPHGRSLRIPRGRGSEKPNFWNKSMTLNWNFWGDGGCKTKHLPWGEDGFFLELNILLAIAKVAWICRMGQKLQGCCRKLAVVERWKFFPNRVYIFNYFKPATKSLLVTIP